jgi:predicted metal-dependent enzyme (double-stranded beta helix superfamily)
VSGILDRLVSDCRKAAEAADPVAEVRAALSQATAEPERAIAEIPAFEGEDYVLHRADDLSVFVVRQAPNTAGPPHDHGMTAVIAMLEGVEIHRRYRREGESIALEREQTAVPGGVLVLAPRDVHAIANPDPTPSLGIHVYLGDIVGIERTLWDPTSGDALAFTLENYESRVRAYR